jgi:outer membrane protein assembly factor BamD
MTACSGRPVAPKLRAMRRRLLIAVSLIALAGCSSTEADKRFEDDKPVEVLYNEAMDAEAKGGLKRAAKLFEEVERQHPYSPWAKQAQIMYAYVLYQDALYDQAEVALDRFIELHPASAETPYAYYLKALIFYEQISDVARDQEMTEKALEALQQVIRRFPDTSYARDAKLKLDLTRDHLAGKEMTIARFYLGQKNYIAAINRFRSVISQYQTTTHAAEALHRLTESYLALGLVAEAQRNAAVLGYNYPGSSWYQYSYDLLQEVGATPLNPAPKE